MKEKLKNLFFKIWYWYISTVDKNAEVIFMNYGYSKDEEKLELSKKDEKNRYSIQLYHNAVKGADITGKEILEVGCGRGGGLSYINRYLLPKKISGIDLNKKAIKFCKKHYDSKNSFFAQANAQKLPFEDNAFDIVLNVESSHRYPKQEQFFNEVYRVLKPGGYFLFTDFRTQNETNQVKLELDLKNSKLKVEMKEDITANVVEALQLASPDRVKLVEKLIPRFLHDLGKNFAATIGSPTYNKFNTREFVYFNYILKKD